MSEQTQATLENRIIEAIDLCVNDLGLKMPLNVVTIDMGGQILAASIHGDGRIVPLIDPGRVVTAPLYPVHTFVVDHTGNSLTLVATLGDERMRTIH